VRGLGLLQRPHLPAYRADCTAGEYVHHVLQVAARGVCRTVHPELLDNDQTRVERQVGGQDVPDQYLPADQDLAAARTQGSQPKGEGGGARGLDDDDPTVAAERGSNPAELAARCPVSTARTVSRA